MIENNGTLIVILIVLALGVLLPLGIFAVARRGDTIGQIELWKRAGRAARHPWAKEDADLDELSQRVQALRSKVGEEPPV